MDEDKIKMLRVSGTTYNALFSYIGKIQVKEGRRITVDEAISTLLEKCKDV